jgi:hypothetical protein
MVLIAALEFVLNNAAQLSTNRCSDTPMTSIAPVEILFPYMDRPHPNTQFWARQQNMSIGG